jgi:hypothetical protein
MKNLILSFLLIISVSAFSQASEKNFIDQNYIEVVGKAQMDVSPDQIYLSIILSEKDNKNKQSLESIEKSMKTKLKEIGVDINKDLYVKDFVSNFKNYFLSKSEVILTKNYQLLIHDTKTLQKVFVEFKNLDISNVTIQKVDNSKMDQYRKEVKANAIKAAKAKAESLAGSINQTIGRAIFIQEFDTDNFLMGDALQGKLAGLSIRGTGMSNYSSEAPETDVEFEKINLNSSIMVRFELK